MSVAKAKPRARLQAIVMLSGAGEARSDSLAESKHPYLTEIPNVGTIAEFVTRRTAS